MIRLLASRLDVVVAVTPEQVTPWLRRGVPSSRICVVPNGVPVPSPQATGDAVRASLALSSNAFVAVVVAALRPEKRVPDFVKAVLKARESCPDLVGLVVGDGPDRAAVSDAIGGSSAIKLLGQRDDVSSVLSACDVAVMSSEFEASPMAIIEAMAAGLPVIATDVGAVREMVRPGETGTLVPPNQPGRIAEAIIDMANNPTDRHRLGANARLAHAQDWDSERMVERYLAVFEEADRSR
jgi:glycosyltransferase involved in cell wall biosynthesis